MKFPSSPAARVLAAGAALLLLSLPSAAEAQSGREILMTALDHYEERMAGIDAYTVVQNTMGFETSTTFVRSELEGRTVFLPEGAEEGVGGMANFYRSYPKIAEEAEVRGEEEVDGKVCWVLVIDDLSKLDLDDEMAMGEEGEFVPKRGTLFIDRDEYLIRKIYMEGEIVAEGQARSMTAETLLTDYREVEGIVHPFKIHVSATGVMPGMSEEELAEAQENLAKMEEQLEGLPEGQKAMVERMLGPQIEKLREMVASGRFEMEILTTKVSRGRAVEEEASG